MVIEPILQELVEAGVHFGHQTHRWNPKMKRYIFGAKNGIYVVDLQKTAQGLEKATQFLRAVAQQGGPILFVGTKKQAQNIILEEAVRCGQYHINFRWLGGLLTNFQTVRRSIERLKTIQAWKEDGTLSRMTKKEAARLEKELVKLERVLSGIMNIGRLPRALVVVDAKREETAVKEANRLGIPVVALVDTNSDPDPISYVIPGNDDAIRSIRLVLSLLANAILEGHQSYLAGIAAEEAAKVKAVKDKADAEAAAAAGEGESGEEVLPEPAIDEVEAIVPEGALKAKIKEADQQPRKKKVSRPKVAAKEDKVSPPANA